MPALAALAASVTPPPGASAAASPAPAAVGFETLLALVAPSDKAKPAAPDAMAPGSPAADAGPPAATFLPGALALAPSASPTRIGGAIKTAAAGSGAAAGKAGAQASQANAGIGPTVALGAVDLKNAPPVIVAATDGMAGVRSTRTLPVGDKGRADDAAGVVTFAPATPLAIVPALVAAQVTTPAALAPSRADVAHSGGAFADIDNVGPQTLALAVAAGKPGAFPRTQDAPSAAAAVSASFTAASASADLSAGAGPASVLAQAPAVAATPTPTPTAGAAIQPSATPTPAPVGLLSLTGRIVAPMLADPPSASPALTPAATALAAPVVAAAAATPVKVGPSFARTSAAPVRATAGASAAGPLPNVVSNQTDALTLVVGPVTAADPGVPDAADDDPSTGGADAAPIAVATAGAPDAAVPVALQTTSTASPGSAPAVSHATVAGLAAEIVQRTGRKASRFDVTLDPDGLGRVDVRLQIAADGRLSARLSFDRPETAAALGARVGELQQALSQAGFDVPPQALSFETASGGFGGGFSHFQEPGGDGGRNGSRAFAAAQPDLDTLPPATPGSSQAASGLDIRI